jgi:hypothetical protein
MYQPLFRSQGRRGLSDIQLVNQYSPDMIDLIPPEVLLSYSLLACRIPIPGPALVLLDPLTLPLLFKV